MQQPQQKRHKLLTIAKPNKQNSGPNKKKTLKTAAGYKSAMAVGVVLGGVYGLFARMGLRGFLGGKNATRAFAQTHPYPHSKQHSHITERAACCVNN